jgi:hypothetical protein
MLKRYVVISPQEAQRRKHVGAYAEQFGWLVRDRQAPASTGQVFWSGSEREMRATARAMNRREAQGTRR